jgi:hypothetical protein
MATDIVQSLFGVTPEMYQRQQDALAEERAIKFAGMDPFERATYGIYRGAGQLGGALGRALGGEDPELARISLRQSIAKQLDFNDPASFEQGFRTLQQAGDLQGAMMLMQTADEAAKRQLARAEQSEKTRQLGLSTLAQRIATSAYQPGGEPAFYGKATGAALYDDEGNLMPGAGVTAPSYDISRVAPQLMALGPTGVAQLKAMQEAQAMMQPKTITVKEGETLYSVPTTPGGEYKPVVTGGEKPTPFTGEMANAANILYRTTDPQKIFARFGQEGLNAVEKKAIELAAEKRPVTNITAPVTISMQKGFGENLTETITSNQRAGRSAASTLGTVENMKTLLDEGVRTGFGQETLLKLGQAGQLFDPNFNTKGLAGQEAFQAFATQIVLPQVKQLGANPTDTDLKFIVGGSPGLAKTVEGNKLLLDTLTLKLQREQDLARFSNQWLAANSRLVKTDPIEAQAKYNTDFEAYTQTSPLYGPAANTLRARYTALGGNVRGSEPARRAAQAGGFTR